MSQPHDHFGEAVLTCPLTGWTLVEASAGTGKTYQIQTLVLRLILEQGWPIEEILVVTFTKAATGELRDRLQAVLAQADAVLAGQPVPPGERRRLDQVLAAAAATGVSAATMRQRARTALRDFDRAAIYTIHGFCQRVLSDCAFECRLPFDLSLSTDSADQLEEATRDAWRQLILPLPPALLAISGAKLKPAEPPKASKGTKRGKAAKAVAEPGNDEAAAPSGPTLVLGDPLDFATCQRLVKALLSKPEAVIEPPVSWPPASCIPLVDAIFEAAAALPEAECRAHLASLVAQNQLSPTAHDRALAALTALRRPPASAEARLLCVFEHGPSLSAPAWPGQTLPPMLAPLAEALAALAGQSAVLALALKHRFVSLTREHLAATRRLGQTQTFDDLLLRLDQALDPERPAVAARLQAVLKARYQVAIVDEFQDTDPIQFRIFRRAFHEQGLPVFVVGDPKQAIYGFRAGDIFTYFEAQHLAQQRYTLRHNWRSTPAMIAAVNRLFAELPQGYEAGRVNLGHPQRAFATPHIQFEPALPGRPNQLVPAGPALELIILDKPFTSKEKASRDITRMAVSQIRTLLRTRQVTGPDGVTRPLQPRELAVLVLKHAEARELKEALREHGIAAVTQSSGNVFASTEAADLYEVISAMQQPADPRRWRRALATPLFPAMAQELCAALTEAGGSQAVARCLEEFTQAHRLWYQHGLIVGLRYLLHQRGVTQHLLGRLNGDRRLTNVLQLAELLDQAAREGQLGPAATLRWFGQQIHAETREADDAHELRLESDADAVQILTVFHSKGLEYEVVVAPFMWTKSPQPNERWLPAHEYHRRRQGAEQHFELVAHLDLHGVLDTDPAAATERARLQEDEMLAEHLRLLYVAVTRARQYTCLITGQIGKDQRCALHYLMRQLTPPPIAGIVASLPEKAVEPPNLWCRRQEEWQASEPDGAPSPLGVACRPVPLAALAGVPPGGEGTGESDAPVALARRKFEGRITKYWRLLSFTSLADDTGRGQPGAHGGRAAEAAASAETQGTESAGRDSDELDNAGEAANASETTSPPAGTPADSRAAADDAANLPQGLFTLPKGKHTGTCWHGIFEQLDFTSPPAIRQALVQVCLERHNLLPTNDLSLAAERQHLTENMVTAALQQPLPMAPLADAAPGAPATQTLATVNWEDRVAELSFCFPVNEHGIALALIAQAITEHLDDWAPPAPVRDTLAEWCDSARKAPAPIGQREADTQLLKGFLIGFMDLVFKGADGRWYLLDWKSNSLEGTAASFTEARLGLEMARHRYFLQYLIYTVALDRYLRQTLPGYDYERDFGGVYYIFLRGLLSPGAACVVADRPPLALVRRLGEVLAAPVAVPEAGTLAPLAPSPGGKLLAPNAQPSAELLSPPVALAPPPAAVAAAAPAPPAPDLLAAHFSPLNLGFADFIQGLAKLQEPRLRLAAALASNAVEEGHICSDLPELHKAGGGQFPVVAANLAPAPPPASPVTAALVTAAPVTLPPLADWLNWLRHDPACRRVIMAPGETPVRPLVLDAAGRLYLQRYHDFETRLSQRLRDLASEAPADCQGPMHRSASENENAPLRERFQRLFPDTHTTPPSFNWTRVAAFAAYRRRLTVISGGPGTGKTSVVVRLLVLLQELALADQRAPLRVKLAAPTGKAAARLSSAIQSSLAEPPRDASGAPNPRYIDSALDRTLVQVEASTIHRLLGSLPNQVSFRHGADNPLAADLIVIDEASMVPLPLMCRILAAVPPEARLILLGDMDQLASVEPGYVLGDICEAAGVKVFSPAFRELCRDLTGLEPPAGPAGAMANTLSDNCLQLSYSWRFPPDSAIDLVSRAVKEADGTPARNPLRLAPLAAARLDWGAPGILASLPDPALGAAKTPTTVHWKMAPARLYEADGQPVALLREHLLARFTDYLNASEPAQVMAAAERFRILCALRQGPHGVRRLNQLVEEVLGLEFASNLPAERAKWAKRGLHRTLPARRGEFYDHRLIMVTENHYSLQLFNGDLGLILPANADPTQPSTAGDEGAKLLAWFPPLSPGQPWRHLPTASLPPHETAFAMTVHKSQGSEFEDVLLILPMRDTPVLSKELIYTGITRAKQRAELWLDPTLFARASARRTARYSGLAEQLRLDE